MAIESEKHVSAIQENILKMITEAQSGHPGGSLSAVDIVSVLYFNVMNITMQNLNTTNRDRFVLSKGHAAPLLYAVLAEKGFLVKDELRTLRKLNSRLQGHPNHNELPGIDMSSGSLGQGISAAVGMALANRLDNNPYRIYTLLGDGECEEGQVWEATMSAAHFHLDNLCAIIDCNKLQIDGEITSVMNPLPLDEKFNAFGWYVMNIDGHDHSALTKALEHTKTIKGKPCVIIAHTIKGHGVDFMEHQAYWHGSAPTKEQCQEALKQIRRTHHESN